MSKALKKEAPQVCEQIGCLLCSLIARICTEYADTAAAIDEARNDGGDKSSRAAPLPEYHRSRGCDKQRTRRPMI
ncbi:MAG: hypothetical protein ACXV4B_08030 [Halobacteriota archaeon]